MWYASFMPTELPKGAIDAADAAVAFAAQVRRYHRRRTDPRSEQRAQDIARAQERLHEAMKPLKSEIGRFVHGPQTQAAEKNRQAIRDASIAIQKERRKLWKLQNPTRKRAA